MDQCEPHNFLACRAAVWIWRTVTLFIVCIGTVFNVLSAIILCGSKMKKLPTSVYLLGLAVSDTGVLWTSSMAYNLQDGFGVDLRTSSQIMCKSLYYLSFLFGTFSVWLIVLLTVDRLLLTRFPVLARRALTRKHATIATAVAFTFCLFVNSHYLVGYAVQTVLVPIDNHNGTNGTLYEYQTVCEPISAFVTFYREIWVELRLSLLVGFPLVIIMVGNVTILITLFFQRRRLRLVAPATESSADAAKTKNRKSITKLLFLITAVFLFTMFPVNINVLVSKTIQNPTPHVLAILDLINTICYNVLFCNFTFNFVLYMLTGSMFRQEGVALLKRWKIRGVNLFRQSGETVSSVKTVSTMSTNDAPQSGMK